MPEVEAIFQKVKRQEEKNLRLQQQMKGQTGREEASPKREEHALENQEDIAHRTDEPLRASDDPSTLEKSSGALPSKASIPDLPSHEAFDDDGDWWDDASPDDTDAPSTPPNGLKT